MSKTGACELCGKFSQELKPLFIGDFIGMACSECREQLRDCQQRRFTSAGEETEPAE